MISRSACYAPQIKQDCCDKNKFNYLTKLAACSKHISLGRLEGNRGNTCSEVRLTPIERRT